MRIILTSIILTISLFSFSQSTLIEYNYQTETYSFYKITRKGDTVTLKKPYAVKGIPTKVVVKDLNTFYYDVAFKSEHFQNTPVNGDESVETLAENLGWPPIELYRVGDIYFVKDGNHRTAGGGEIHCAASLDGDKTRVGKTQRT